jgi:hypothetical protein
MACARAIESALDDVSDVDPIYMPTADKADALLALTRLQSRLGELRGRVLAAADDVAEAEGARDPAAWLAHRARLDGEQRPGQQPLRARQRELTATLTPARPARSRSRPRGGGGPSSGGTTRRPGRRTPRA